MFRLIWSMGTKLDLDLNLIILLLKEWSMLSQYIVYLLSEIIM